MIPLSAAMDLAVKQMQNDAPLVRLLSVALPTTPPSMLRLANHDRDLSRGATSTGAPIVWKRFPFSIGDLRDNRKGDLPNLAVNVCNVTREFMSWIDQYRGLSGQIVTFSTVHAGFPDAPEKIDFEAEVMTCEVTQLVATFTLGAPRLARQSFPAGRWLTQCGVEIFGGPECGYMIPAVPTGLVGGGFATCPRSLEACRKRGDDEVARGLTRMHPRLFDAAPGIKPGNP